MSQPLSFEQAVRAVGAYQKRGWRLGLDRMQELVRRAGLASSVWGGQGPKYVHIAGTNGKGSVTAMTYALLAGPGRRPGAYLSPYVYRVNERIRGPQGDISDADFAAMVSRMLPFAGSMEGSEWDGPTEFEMKTLVGFGYWADQRCDAVALEVGLGGRLDATNVVTAASTAIVSIGWDHMEILGDTLGKIAAEKAGIVKAGVPLVVGETEPEPEAVILGIAREVGAPVWRVGHEVRYEPDGGAWRVVTPSATYPGLVPGLVGSVQPHNMAVAVAAVDAAGLIGDPGTVADRLSRTFLPGRFQAADIGGVTVILDGAHNLPSGEALSASLRSRYGAARMALVTGMLHGHDPRPFYGVLASMVVEAHLTPIDFHRTRSAAELAEDVGDTLPGVTLHSDSAAAFAAARQAVLEGRADAVLVSGSFYLVGEVGRALGLG